MLKTLLFAAALLATASQVSAAPPGGGGGYRGGGGYHGGHGYYGGRPGWNGGYWGAGYWGPGFGFYYGGPGYWGGSPYGWNLGYAYPYALAPWVIDTQPVAQVFIQQEPVAAAPAPAQAAPANSFWYYCTQPAGYFPYVQNCSQPWMKVVPQVPSDQPTAPRLAP